MYSYVAYGLGIRSALLLPELVDGEATADVVVRWGSVAHLPLEAHDQGTWTSRANAQEFHLFNSRVGSFLVRGGHEIIIAPVPGVEERELRILVLGPVLAILLHQRGLLVLHSSAVAVNGGAVAFLGESGWGKSTMAAALHTRGHGIVSDDVTAVQVNAGSAMVLPGFPQLKLWPEAAASLGDVPETLPRLHPRFEKRARCVDRGFPQTPLPLKRIYVLAEGVCLEIELLRLQDAFVELVRHSHAVRLLEATGTTASHFRHCVGLASCVPIFRLKRQRSLSALPDLARLVEEDIAQTIC